MSSSKLPFPMPVNGIIHFPRTDGSPECRPTLTKENAPAGVYNYHELIDPNEERHKRWRQKVGFYLIKLLEKYIKTNPYMSYTIAEFPEHYGLYTKPRMTGATEDRDDLYLYGSKYVNNFRSPREFVFHAYWLMTDPTLNNKNCECTWCSGTPQKELSKRLGASVDHYSDGTNKHRGQPRADFREDARDTPPASPIEPPGRVAQDHLRDHPPHRVGELVWAQLRPPIRGESDNQVIDCWPGVVLEIRPRVVRTETGLDRQTGLKLRLLGTLYDTIIDAFDTVPYHAYNIPRSLHNYISNTKPENVSDEASYDRLSDIKLFIDSAFDKRPRQATFDQVWPAFIIGRVMTYRLADRWTLARISADPTRPTTPRTPAPQSAAPAAQKDMPWDSIWWGAECIWVGDLIRLRTTALQDSPLLRFVSPGAETRCLFLKLDKIQTSKATSPAHVWLTGTLYETVPDNGDEEEAAVEPAKPEGVDASSLNGLVALSTEPEFPAAAATASLPDPPMGFRFKPVLASTHMCYVQLTHVAGRYYPHLEFSPLLTSTRATNEVRPPQILSLAGYAPADVHPQMLPGHHQSRKNMWEELEGQAKAFLLNRFISASRPLKPEPRR